MSLSGESNKIHLSTVIGYLTGYLKVIKHTNLAYSRFKSFFQLHNIVFS